jgi:DNA/RNA-binding domain of Phe-tRNA-synthetase-like protein
MATAFVHAGAEEIFLPHYATIYKPTMAETLAIDNLLAGRLSAGINIFRGLSPRPAADLQAHIAAQLPAIRAAHGSALPPGFAMSRQLYRSFHVDPTKHRPSSEALWRRLRGHDDFPAVNPAVDLTNLLSLQFQICFGLYDMNRIQGPVVITLGSAGDRYQGIRKELLDFDGKIVLRDDLGAFGNPSADSLRASVGEGTRDILQVLFFAPVAAERERILAAALAAFTEFFTMTGNRSYFI